MADVKQRTVDEVCDDEEWFRHDLVEYMRSMGWADGPNRTAVHNGDPAKSFPSYFEAIKACIAVASEM